MAITPYPFGKAKSSTTDGGKHTTVAAVIQPAKGTKSLEATASPAGEGMFLTNAVGRHYLGSPADGQKFLPLVTPT